MKGRIAECIVKLSLENLDALLVSSSPNVTYLSGFRDAEGYLLVARGLAPVYFTNFLYKYEAQKLADCNIRVNSGNTFKSIARTAKTLKIKRLGFEAKNISFLEYRKIRDFLMDAGIDFVKTVDIVEGLRSIKSPREISHIKKATSITKEGLEFAREIASADTTERQLAIEVEKFLRIKADTQTAFTTIIATGKNSAFPHHLCGTTKMQRKFFLIDLGAKYYGYCADLTRVFFWGKMPRLFYRIYDIVRKAKDLSIAKVKDGAAVKEIDRAARNYIEKKGFAKYFGHNIGHGVGLSVHEAPSLSAQSEEVLRENMLITIEPGIYLDGNFGIRIEDMVLVKSNKGEVISAD